MKNLGRRSDSVALYTSAFFTGPRGYVLGQLSYILTSSSQS